MHIMYMEYILYDDYDGPFIVAVMYIYIYHLII